MTSEGPHHPGHEPDKVPPGGGAAAPYGDRPVQQDNGYGAPAADLGWAPPPPTRPDPAAPAWANQPGAGWGSPQANRPAPGPNSGTWAPATAGGQPSWSAQGEQPTANWAPPSTSDQPAWVNGGQSASAWGTGADANQATAEWTPNQTPVGQSPGGQPGAAQPAGWAGGQQPEWNGAPRPAEQPPGWAAAANPVESAQPGWAQAQPPTPQPDWAQANPPAQPDWAQSNPSAQPNWAAGGSPAQPDWAQPNPSAQPEWAQADQPAPRPEPAARATAQVPQAEPAPQPPSTPDDPGQPRAWSAEQQEQPNWAANQVRQPEAGGWAGADRPAGGDRPAQPDWAAPQPAESSAWPGGGTSADERPQWSPPTQDASAWAPNEAAAPPLPSRTPERAPLTEVEPWAPGEAWGSGGSSEAEASRPDTGRSDDSPVYQPAPAPGISPANMVPLPPQEQRVPGASLAGAPPGDYSAPAQFSGEQAAPLPRPNVEQSAGGTGWGQPEPRQEDASAEAAIPAPRTSPESVGRATPPAASGGVSASASVPTASRVTPPADHVVHPTGTPAPRVYGRPTRPESEESAQDREEPPSAPRLPQGADPRLTNHEQPGPNAFANGAAPAVPAFPPSVPSFADAQTSHRPVNGVKPHPEPDHPADRFGGAAGGPFDSGSAADPFREAPRDPFAGPVDRPGVTYGSPARPESDGEHTSAFPPAPQANAPWSPSTPDSDPEQGRFDAFKPVAEPAADAPPPKVRNGRVLAAVLVAAVLILAIPLGLLLLLGKFGGSDDAAAFDPAVGTCVKRSGETAVEAVCGEPESFSVVSKVDSKDKCPDPALPHVELRGNVTNPVLCLKNATD